MSLEIVKQLTLPLLLMEDSAPSQFFESLIFVQRLQCNPVRAAQAAVTLAL